MFPRNLHLPLQAVVSVAPYGCFMRAVGSVCVWLSPCGMLQEKAFFMVSVSKKWQYCQKNDANKRGGEQRSVDSNDNGIITVGLFDFLLKPDLP